MSPPTPVRDRSEINLLYRKQLSDPKKYECSLKSLTQLECTFRISPTSSTVQETICIPFKRVFQRCRQDFTKREYGKKVSATRWINIEVTNFDSNDSIKQSHGEEVQRFLQAEKDLVKWMEMGAES